MAVLGTFTLVIDGERLDGTPENKARLHLKAQGPGTLRDDDGDQFKFPAQFAKADGVPISLPYELTLFTDSTSGNSTTIGYEGYVRTDEGRVTFQFAAPQAGATVQLVDLTDDVVTPISDLQVFRDEAETARDEAVAAAASVPTVAELSATYGRGISVTAHGAKGDGVTDDTAAITAAFAAAVATGGSLFFPKGNFVYNGPGLTTGGQIEVWGLGPGQSTVTLGATSRLIDVGGTGLTALRLSGLKVIGGVGAFRSTRTANQVSGIYAVTDCNFDGYTGACIETNSTDWPYWKIQRNIFKGGNYTTTIGIALSGLSDGDDIGNNEFLANRVGVKLGRGGNNAYLHHNDFIRFGGSAGSPRVDVWFVPNTTTTNAGAGALVQGNKFGNENLAAGDYRIVYADEGSGTGFGDKMPNLGADSTGYISGHTITDNLLNGASSAVCPFVYSTTPNVIGSRIAGVLAGAAPDYILKYRTAPAADRDNSTNLFGPFTSADNTAGVDAASPALSNDPGAALLNDPALLFSGAGRLAFPGGSDPTGYANLLATGIRSFTLAAGATTANITDALGGTDAAEITFGPTSLAYAAISAPGIGKATWIEMDLAQGTTSPATTLQVQMQYTSNGAIHMRRIITLPTTPGRFRFLWQPREATTGINLVFSTSGGGSVKIGRVRCYQAAEPQMDQVARLSQANTWTQTQTITSPGTPLQVNRTGGGDTAVVFQTDGTARAQMRASSASRVKITNAASTVEYIGWDTSENTIIRNADTAGGAGAVAIKNCATAPSATPAAGGVLYVESGILKYKGSSGTVTNIAPA